MAEQKLKLSGKTVVVDVCLRIPHALRQRVRVAEPKINMTHAFVKGLEDELKEREKVKKIAPSKR